MCVCVKMHWGKHEARGKAKVEVKIRAITNADDG